MNDVEKMIGSVGERLNAVADRVMSEPSIRESVTGRVKAMNWQPIESAPKDGTKILTYGLGHGNNIASHEANERAFPMYSIAFWAWYDSEQDVEVSPGLFRKEPCRVLEGWRTEWRFTPSHWMPLPAPPTA